MDFQYKLIVGNQTFYKEFEIPAELERVKLGSTSNCEFRLNSDFFFEDIEISLEKKENWNILCSDNLYISRGDLNMLAYHRIKCKEQLIYWRQFIVKKLVWKVL